MSMLGKIYGIEIAEGDAKILVPLASTYAITSPMFLRIDLPITSTSPIFPARQFFPVCRHAIRSAFMQSRLASFLFPSALRNEILRAPRRAI